MGNAFYINVNPVAFTLGPLKVSWYGMMVALAVLTVVLWGIWKGRKVPGLNLDTIVTAAVVGIPSGIVMSKVLHVIDEWGYYWQNPAKILSGEGLTIWGAVLGAALGIWIYSRFNRNLKYGVLADLLAPGIILSQAVGRIGCTLNGCCYGIETHLPWAIIYTHPNSYGPLGIPVHPTQVYEIMYNLVVFGILVSLQGKVKPAGSVFFIYLALYGAWRLGIELIRDGTPFIFGMHQAQFIGIVVLFITVPLLAYRSRWVKSPEQIN
jgi:phosphatidylglycerol---prolipoprotein diacylglyceryl transferase